MKKAEVLERWRELEPDQRLNPRMVPYKHEGSTFDQDGIRITGTPEFVDSVLSRLKSLLQYEGDNTRLGLSMTNATDRHTKRELGTVKCYIQVHERGGQAKIMNAMFNAHR